VTDIRRKAVFKELVARTERSAQRQSCSGHSVHN